MFKGNRLRVDAPLSEDVDGDGDGDGDGEGEDVVFDLSV